jgi:hypothetical protein
MSQMKKNSMVEADEDGPDPDYRVPCIWFAFDLAKILLFFGHVHPILNLLCA